MNKPIIAVANLSVAVQNHEILQNISFAVHEKEVLVIIGPNGAGKSTLLRALLGLVAYRGSVEWRINTRIGYIPSQERINREAIPPISVEEFFYIKKSSRSVTANLLESVGLAPRIIDASLKNISTGEFQRMLIAWALVNDPEVLLLDEPTVGLDIGGEETIYTLLHALWKERGLTILLVTHSMHIVWQYAQHVLCLNKTVLEYGVPEKVLTREMLEKIYGKGVSLYEHRHTD